MLLSLDEPGSRERLLRVAATNTRDGDQWRPLQLVPEVGVLWPAPASLTTPPDADRSQPGELSRLWQFGDRPSRERAIQGAETVQALAATDDAARSAALDAMDTAELETVVERALVSGSREVADAVWLRWRRLSEQAGTPLPADVVEHLHAVAAQLRRRVETWSAQRIEQTAAPPAYLGAFRDRRCPHRRRRSGST